MTPIVAPSEGREPAENADVIQRVEFFVADDIRFHTLDDACWHVAKSEVLSLSTDLLAAKFPRCLRFGCCAVEPPAYHHCSVFITMPTIYCRSALRKWVVERSAEIKAECLAKEEER